MSPVYPMLHQILAQRSILYNTMAVKNSLVSTNCDGTMIHAMYHV